MFAGSRLLLPVSTNFITVGYSYPADLVREVTFFVLNESSDFRLVSCQCNPKALVKSTVSQGATIVALYGVHVWKTWLTCVCWSKHTEHDDRYFLNVRELMYVDISPKHCRPVSAKLLCHGYRWLHVNKFECEFPLVNGRNHLLCSGG